MENIDYSKLKQTIKNLKEQYNAYLKLKEKGFNNSIEKNIYETAIVKCFETSFEMAWKHLKKYLKTQGHDNLPSSPKQIVRIGYQSGVIEHGDLWLEYLEKRNFTSHDYSSEKAFNILAVVEDFIKDLEEMYERIIND